MEQNIIEVPYSDSVPTQVITIDLPHQPSVPHGHNVQTSTSAATTTSATTTTTLLEPAQIGHSITQLQQSTETTNRDECHQLDIKPMTNVAINDSTNNNEFGNGNSTQDDDSSSNNNNNNTSGNQEKSSDNPNGIDENNTSNGSRSTTRFKWTKEKSQVAMNLVKHGCKPKLVSIAVGCSLRTAQKFVETVTPKMEGESFKIYEIRRRGRKSKDVNQRLNAIKEVLSKDSTKTQVEIAADLKVSNTTVCRDLKRLKIRRTKRKKAA